VTAYSQSRGMNGPSAASEFNVANYHRDKELTIQQFEAVEAARVSGRWQDRADVVKSEFKRAFAGYRQYAQGADELKSVSDMPHNWLYLGTTIVSGMDTMRLMGLNDEFEFALDFVRNDMDIANNNASVSLFETTIRVLGGLLGAYESSRESVLLQRAQELADALLPALVDVPNGIPSSHVTPSSGKIEFTSISLAELGTLDLEFYYLSQKVGDPKYQQAVDNVMQHVFDSGEDLDGLYPTNWNVSTGRPAGKKTYTMGGGGDSFYEYLVKRYILSGRTEPVYLEKFEKAVSGMKSNMLKYSNPSKYMYLDEVPSRNTFGHLACFAGAMMVLYDTIVIDGNSSTIGTGIGRTCYEMYMKTPLHLAPETVTFSNGVDFYISNGHDYLRPEAIETITYLWWMTGDEMYRDWGWEMFQGKRFCFCYFIVFHVGLIILNCVS
jgi:Glycosyl hydrolase family 47